MDGAEAVGLGHGQAVLGARVVALEDDRQRQQPAARVGLELDDHAAHLLQRDHHDHVLVARDEDAQEARERASVVVVVVVVVVAAASVRGGLLLLLLSLLLFHALGHDGQRPQQEAVLALEDGRQTRVEGAPAPKVQEAGLEAHVDGRRRRPQRLRHVAREVHKGDLGPPAPVPAARVDGQHVLAVLAATVRDGRGASHVAQLHVVVFVEEDVDRRDRQRRVEDFSRILRSFGAVRRRCIVSRSSRRGRGRRSDKVPHGRIVPVRGIDDCERLLLRGKKLIAQAHHLRQLDHGGRTSSLGLGTEKDAGSSSSSSFTSREFGVFFEVDLGEIVQGHPITMGGARALTIDIDDVLVGTLERERVVVLFEPVCSKSGEDGRIGSSSYSSSVVGGGITVSIRERHEAMVRTRRGHGGGG